MNKITSIQETCKSKDCNNTFTRYQYQIKKGTGLFCSQQCAAITNNPIRSQKKNFTDLCIYCKENNKVKKSAYCRPCLNIKERTRLFGLTIDDFHDMMKNQNNKCSICKTDKCSTGRNFAIDHDHVTGNVRGLLCCGCNIRLGWYENNKLEIENYLRVVDQ